MELITRRDAIIKGLGRFYTGVPCRHGHSTYRYTSSGGCVECVHPTFINLERQERRARALQQRQDKAAAISLRERTKAVLSQMKRIRIYLHTNDVELFESVVFAAAIAREPNFTLKQIRTPSTTKPLGRDWGLYSYWCFPEDESTLRTFQDTLRNGRVPIPAAWEVPIIKMTREEYIKAQRPLGWTPTPSTPPDTLGR